MGTVTYMSPRGHYLAQEVGQLAGVSGHKVGQWANYGYIRASQSDEGEYPKVYSYQDVAEAMIVHELLEKHVPLPVLRPVIEELRNQLGDWPLQHASLETLSSPEMPLASLLVRDGEQRLELGEHGWQMIADATVNPERVSVELRRGGWAVRQLPDLQHIEVDPDLLSGRPAIRGTRVPASLVAELAAVRNGDDVLREDYDLTRDQIQDAVRWWQATTSFERVAA